MENKNQQFINYSISLGNAIIKHRQFLFVNCIGIVGIIFAFNLCIASAHMITGPLPVEYYYFMCAGSVVYVMYILLQLLKFNGRAMISKK